MRDQTIVWNSILTSLWFCIQSFRGKAKSCSAYLFPQDISDGDQKEGINEASDLTLHSHWHFFFHWDGWWRNCAVFMNENFEDGHVEPQRTEWLRRWVGRMMKKRRAFRSMWKANICNHLIVTSSTLWGRNSQAYSFQTEEIDCTEWPV